MRAVRVLLVGGLVCAGTAALAARPELQVEDGRILKAPGYLETLGLRPAARPATPARRPSPSSLAALERLRDGSSGTWQVDWDAATGTPIMIWGGKAGPYQGAPEAAARAFLRDYADLFRVTPGEALRHDGTVTSRGGIHVGFVQQHRGLPVLDGTVQVLLDAEGYVRMASGGFHPVPPSTPSMGIAADEALLRVLRHVDARTELSREVSPGLPPTGIPGAERLEYGASDVIPGRLMRLGRVRAAWYPDADGFRIVWMVDVSLDDAGREFRVYVDGETGDPLDAIMLSTDTHETIRVYRTNPDRSDLTDEAIRDVDKPDVGGPLDGAFTIMDNEQAAPIADAPYNHSTDPNDPTVDLNFDEQNVYYHSNLIRQFFVDVNGGPAVGSVNLDTDPLDAWVHRIDSGDANVNNASYYPSLDLTRYGHGSFHLGELLGLRDLALEDSVVYHEYSHRINDNIAGFTGSSIYNGALNEAFADYWATSFADDKYVGEFANADPEEGDDSGWVGLNGFIRSMDNDRTFGNVCDNPFVTGGCEVHSDGEIFGGILWDLRQEMIRSQGKAQGVATVDALVLEALFNMTGGGPFDNDTFIEGRNALYTADVTLFAGANRCTIAQVFANRQMGDGATDGPPPLTSTALPADCVGSATMAFSRPFYSCLAPDSASLRVDDPDGGSVAAVTVTTDSGDLEVFPLSWAGPVGTTASFAVDIVVPTPGNGIVEVSTEGERILALYDDTSPVRSTYAASTVDCMPDLRFRSSRVFNGSCNDDDPFLDAGESALLTATVGLELGIDVTEAVPPGLTLTLVSNNPDVTVVAPATVVPAATLGKTDVRFEGTWAVEADAGVSPGATVDFDILVGGPGILGSAAPIAFTRTLEQDLNYVAKVIDFNFDSGPQGFSTAANGASGTETWFHQTAACTFPTDPGYWHQGANNCGVYDINDSSWLVSPPIRFQEPNAPFPSRLVALRFQHQVSFDVDAAAAPFIEADRFDQSSNLLQLPALYDSTNNEPGFQAEAIDLTSGVGVDLSHGWVTFRWLFIANNGGGGNTPSLPGWYVDDVELEYEEPQIDPDGNTSGACAPVVDLSLDSLAVLDGLLESGAGNTDGIVDPGETINLPVGLVNGGTGTAEAVLGTLTSNRPDIITINDGSAPFPNIIPLGAGASQGDHFTFTVDPAAACGDVVDFTLTVDHNGVTGATVIPFSLTLGSLGPPLVADDFEADTGLWTVNAGGTDTATTGIWQRADPIQNCYSDACGTNNETQPGDDFLPGTSTGSCFITQNGGAPFNLHDIDGGVTTFQSTNLDLSSAVAPTVSYARWVYNRDGDPLDAFTVEVSDNGGASWTTLESVSDANGIPFAPVTNVWVERTFLLSDFVASPTSSTMRFRFTAQDQDPGQIIEAAVDGFAIHDTVPVCNVYVPAIPPEVSPPGAATPFTVSRSVPGTLDLGWQSTAGASTYRIISGDLASLASSGGVTAVNAAPLVCGVPGTTVAEAEPAGSVFLLVAGASTGGVGPLGSATGGAARTAGTTCP